MALNMTTARKLCTKSELELVLDSTPAKIGELSPAELRGRVRRARTLRDKYGTLASRQRRIARGKQEKRGVRPSKSNENTLRKQEIFDQVLERFEAKLERLERAEAKAEGAAKKAARKPTKKRAKRSGKMGKPDSGEPDGDVAAPGRKRARLAKKAGQKKAGAKKGRTLKKGVVTRKPIPTSLAGSAGGLGGAASGAGAFDSEAGVQARSAWNTSMRVRSESTRRQRVQRTQQQTNRPAILGHVSSRGRRSQARRDSR